MVEAILFIIIFKMISAPTWCFVICWTMFGLSVIKFIAQVYKFGRDRGRRDDD